MQENAVLQADVPTMRPLFSIFESRCHAPLIPDVLACGPELNEKIVRLASGVEPYLRTTSKNAPCQSFCQGAFCYQSLSGSYSPITSSPLISIPKPLNPT